MALGGDAMHRNLLGDVLEAQDLDHKENHLEAVRKYLTCLKSLSDRLLIDSYSAGLQMSGNSMQYAKLCIMCSERIKDILENNSKGTKETMRMSSSQQDVGVRSPIETAWRQNSILMRNHQERISRLLNPDRHHSLNLTLSLQRKMTENIVIAERHRQNLEKKKEEKMKQIIEDTEKKFRDQTCFSEHEIIQKKIYSDVLKFELNNKSWDALRNNGKDSFTQEFIVQLIDHITKLKNHPLTMYLQGEQFRICFKIKDIIDNLKVTSEPPRDDKLIERVKDEVTLETKKSFSHVTRMFMFVYEQLDNVGNRAVLHDCLEPHFFAPLWGFMKDLFRLSLVDIENNLTVLMNFSKGIKFTPSCVGVPEKFQLTQEEIPYRDAINLFNSIVKQQPLSSKLKYLSDAFREICQCVKRHNPSNDVDAEIGADELLPILSYCLIASDSPDLYIECHILMDMTDDSQLLGESGYCLASMLTCLEWISGLTIDSINKASD